MHTFNIPPLREDYFETDRTYHIVHVYPSDKREQFVQLLESYGFVPRNYTRDSMIATYFPFRVDFEKRDFTVIWHTCGAARCCDARVVMQLDEFTKVFERDIKMVE